MRDAAAHAPATKESRSTHRTIFRRLEPRVVKGTFRIPVEEESASGELSGHIRKKETGNAVFVAALFLVQHSCIVPVHERGLLFRLRSREEKPARDPCQIRTVGRFYE